VVRQKARQAEAAGEFTGHAFALTLPLDVVFHLPLGTPHLLWTIFPSFFVITAQYFSTSPAISQWAVMVKVMVRGRQRRNDQRPVQRHGLTDRQPGSFRND